MMRKILLTITIMILLVVVSYNGYKYKIYNDFKGYLHNKYPKKTFSLHWVKYDFLYNRFFSKAYCSNDGTEFTVSGNSNNIDEKYLLEKNKKPITQFINSYLSDDDFYSYIQNVTAGAEDEEILDTKNEIDYNELVYDVFVQYKYNSILDNQHFAEISYEIIKELKNNGIKLNMISFDYEKDKQVFSLLLQGEDISSPKADITKFIERRK